VRIMLVKQKTERGKNSYQFLYELVVGIAQSAINIEAQGTDAGNI
jgi:hypothetical protein